MGRCGAEIATEGRWMGVRVIQRGAAVTGAHLEGRGSQGHGGRRRGRLPWLALALINAAERTFLPASNFSLSQGICKFSQQEETFDFARVESPDFKVVYSFYFALCVHKQKENKKRDNPTRLCAGKQS